MNNERETRNNLDELDDARGEDLRIREKELDESERYLNQGWEFVATLPNEKVIIRKLD